MSDTIGNIPKIKSKKHALKEILFVANDKRSHVTTDDAYDWLELKMKVIKKLAKEGLKQ
jgi:hypothetical protein